MWGLVIAIILIAITILLMPKPKQIPDTSKEMDDPTASAGIPIPVVFGTLRIKDLNVLWFGSKRKEQYEIST